MRPRAPKHALMPRPLTLTAVTTPASPMTPTSARKAPGRGGHWTQPGSSADRDPTVAHEPAPALRELSAALHVQLESLLHIVGAESGRLLLLEASADATHLSPPAPPTPPADRVDGPTGSVAAALTFAAPSVPRGGGAEPDGKSSAAREGPSRGAGAIPCGGFFRLLASLGPPHPAFVNESMQSGVVATGVAVSTSTAAGDAFMCFPIRSAAAARGNIGVVIAAHRGATGDFTEGDEAACGVAARLMGVALSRYPVRHLRCPYDAARLASFGVAPLLQRSRLLGDGSGALEVPAVREELVFRSSTAPQLLRRNIAHERYTVPQHHHLREVGDHLARLEAVIESQRAEVLRAMASEDEQAQRLQAARRELTIAQQSAARAADTNMALRDVVAEMQRREHDRRVTAALSRKMQPSEELEEQVRGFLLQAGRGKAMIPPGGSVAAPPTRSASQRPATSVSSRGRTVRPPSGQQQQRHQQGTFSRYPDVADELWRLLRAHPQRQKAHSAGAGSARVEGRES